MKKIFLIVLSVMMLLFIQVRVGAVITQFEYDLTFTEGVTFNLETGDYGEDDDYSSTARIRIFYNSLWIRNFTVGLDLEAHHILFWTDTNQYLGYQNLVETSYEGSKFLGNATLPEITIPTNAVKFSIVARHTDEETKLIPHDLELDTPIADLNNHTLREVFEDTSLFDTYQLVTNGDFDITMSTDLATVIKTGLVIPANQKMYVSYNQLDAITSNIRNTPQMRNTNNIYTITLSTATNYRLSIGFYSDIFTPTSEVNILQHWGHTLNPVPIRYRNYMLFNISTLIANKQYSPLYEDTFDNLTDEEIKAQMDEFVTKPYLFIDYETLGFELSTTQMDYWYNVYTRVKEKTDVTYNDFFTAVDITPTNEADYEYLDSSHTQEGFGLQDYYFSHYSYTSDGSNNRVIFDDEEIIDTNINTTYQYIRNLPSNQIVAWVPSVIAETAYFDNITIYSTTPFNDSFSTDGNIGWNYLTTESDKIDFINDWVLADFEYFTESKLLFAPSDYISVNYAEWLAEYNILKEYNAISYVNFETTFAFYLRDIEEEVELDLDERIDQWLMDVGLDSTFSKIVIVVVLMAIFAIILALVHAPAILIMIVEAFIVIIFTALGFIPLWMDVVIALLFGGLLYLKLTNGNGGEEE